MTKQHKTIGDTINEKVGQYLEYYKDWSKKERYGKVKAKEMVLGLVFIDIFVAEQVEEKLKEVMENEK